MEKWELQICISMHTFVNVLKTMGQHQGFGYLPLSDITEYLENHHSPEVQIMCRFTRESSLYHIQPSAEFHEPFSRVYPLSDVQSSGSQTISTMHWVQMTSSDLTVVKWSIDLTYFKLPTKSL